MSIRGNPRNFSYTLPTQSDRDTFWEVWTDVAAWPSWDSPLAKAYLIDKIGLGAKGELTTKTGQSSTFTISEFEPHESYAFTTRLPGASLVVRRYFTSVGDELLFTHNVSFEGALAVVFAQLLGRGFMRDLPPAMENLRRTAEKGSDKR